MLSYLRTHQRSVHIQCIALTISAHQMLYRSDHAREPPCISLRGDREERLQGQSMDLANSPSVARTTIKRAT